MQRMSKPRPVPAAAAIQPQGCTNFKLRQLMRRVGQHYDLEMAKIGLKTTQYSLLSHVLKLGAFGMISNLCSASHGTRSASGSGTQS